MSVTSILSRIFGRRAVASAALAPPASPSKTTEPRLSFGAAGDRFVRIASLDFFGPYRRSPNGAWLIAWRDGNDAGTHGGHRASGPGRFYLYHGEALVAQGRAERPNDGLVANDGSFIINDWGFNSGLSGTFRAYRSDGSLILERAFAANLVNNGLADDGRFAACQAANAPHSTDSSILAVFDLRSGTEIASWVPESGWADSYSFPPGDVAIGLHDRDGVCYNYTLGGEFIDRAKWIDQQARSGNAYALDHILRDMDGPVSGDVAATMIAGLETALANPDFDERQRALALKVRGRCLEAQGDLAAALASYDDAIALDPKIGLKRRVAQLRRELS